jgi:hypothetical protein
MPEINDQTEAAAILKLLCPQPSARVRTSVAHFLNRFAPRPELAEIARGLAPDCNAEGRQVPTSTGHRVSRWRRFDGRVSLPFPVTSIFRHLRRS